MKTALIGLMMFVGMSGLADSQENIDINHLCAGKYVNFTKSPLMVVDKGFCAEFGKSELTQTLKQKQIDPNCPVFETKDKWKIRLYASTSYTKYFNTNVTFKSSRYNVEIKDYEWAERGSREFFLPKTWKEKGNNPLQMIDEPTNTFVLSIEKNGNEFFLSAFHPKFLQAVDQVKHYKGNIDGVEVDEVGPINKPFDGYNNVLGESELVRNQNTHKQMSFELGYGDRFKLLDSKIGNITYVPSIAAGVMVGENLSVMVKEGEYWEFDEGLDKYGVQGFGGSVTNRLEFNTKKERFGVFYENKLSYYKQEHGFLDGTQKYNLGYMGNSVGMKFMLYNPNNHVKRH